MKAYIKKEKWTDFKSNRKKYGFSEENKTVYAKRIDKYIILIVNKRTKELKLFTMMGSAAFIDAHKENYQDLINDDFIRFEKTILD